MSADDGSHKKMQSLAVISNGSCSGASDVFVRLHRPPRIKAVTCRNLSSRFALRLGIAWAAARGEKSFGRGQQTVLPVDLHGLQFIAPHHGRLAAENAILQLQRGGRPHHRRIVGQHQTRPWHGTNIEHRHIGMQCAARVGSVAHRERAIVEPQRFAGPNFSERPTVGNRVAWHVELQVQTGQRKLAAGQRHHGVRFSQRIGHLRLKADDRRKAGGGADRQPHAGHVDRPLAQSAAGARTSMTSPL